MQEKITAKAAIGIQKPAEIIFEAIVNPDLMTNYFISKSSGRMEAGAELQWSFPEFEEGYPVSVKEVVPNEKVSFVWDPESLVEIKLEKIGESDTVVRVTETGKTNDEAGVKWALGQTEGWSNFVASMKAFLEYGVHLRKGAFEYMKNHPQH